MLKRLFGLALATLALGAQAATYPERPIQIVVPYSAGGIADIMARRIADELSSTLDTSVVVMNRGGANAIIGTQAVARAKPDGYTVLFTPNTPLSINPLLRKDLPYSATDDLEILSILVESPIVVLARPEIGVNNLREMAELARTREGGLNYSAVSAPGPLTLPMNKMQNALQFEMTAIPYPGAGQAMNALLAGDVDVSINALGLALPHMETGAVKAIAVGTEERLQDMPAVETIEETLPGFKTSMWYSLSVPTGVPPQVRETLVEAFKKLRDSEGLQELFARNYLTIPPFRTPEEVKVFQSNDLERWRSIIAESGIEPN